MLYKLFLMNVVWAGVAFAAPRFTLGPTLSRDAANRWWAEFTVNEYTDVAVSIVNTIDSGVVRHLAAGVLGATAPLPFAKNDLHQRIEWNGKDDLGQTVVSTGSLSVRVRAGMTTQLIGLYGGDPYSIGAYSSDANFYGIVAGNDGSVYVAGMPAGMHHEHYGTNFITIRKFDKDGSYVKTIFPEPSNLTQAQVSGWGVVNLPDGSYSPKNVNTSIPLMTTTIVGYMSHQFGSSLQYINSTGDLVFGAIKTLTLKPDGSLPGSGNAADLISSPAWPTPNPGYSMYGHAVLTPLRNGKILFSGLFHYTGSLGTGTQIAPDTHFWRDGKVFLLDPATGVATAWLSIDSVPQTSTERLARMQGNYGYAALQGTAQDSSGRIYVCDRLHQRVGVYDANAANLRYLPVIAPHRVAVCGRTGNVFVVTQTQAVWGGSSVNVVKIIKFASFAQGNTPVCTLQVASATLGRSGVSAVTNIAVNDVSSQTTLWIGVPGAGVKLYRDDGTTLTLVRDMGAESRRQNELGSENPTPDRLVVDRRNENLFISNSWYSLYKITDWSNPIVRPCSTKTKKRLYASDVTISPNNLLYMFEGTTYTGPVTRYTLDSKTDSMMPKPFANTGQDTLTPSVYSRFSPCSGVRGLAVAPDGRVAVMGLAADRNTYYVGIYADSGSRVKTYGKVQLGSVSHLSGGVKFDLHGNLYVGSGYRTSPFAVPDVFLTDTGFKWGVGSVFKFNGLDSGAILATGPVNAAKAYNLPLSPFSADRRGGCVCRSPRFDLDPYGRLFLPSAVTCQVSIADNEGNLIHRFGKYGNLDSRGNQPGLPTQDVVAGSEIPLGWPTSVAASEDYLYVSDYINYRIVRVKMTYAADNMPGLSLEPADTRRPAPRFSLSSGPVPFSTATTVMAAIPDRAKARLCVYDARGRLVRTLADRTLAPGMHRFSWDGRDAAGRNSAVGLYAYKLEVAGKVLTAKTLLAK